MCTVDGPMHYGDSDNQHRYQFWCTGMNTCFQCHKKSIKSTEHVRGVRMNGDGYGVVEYKCTECGWSTSFLYDEAAETYLYETERFRREKEEEEKAKWKTWSNKECIEWAKEHGNDNIQKCFQQHHITGKHLQSLRVCEWISSYGLSQGDVDIVQRLLWGE